MHIMSINQGLFRTWDDAYYNDWQYLAQVESRQHGRSAGRAGS